MVAGVEPRAGETKSQGPPLAVAPMAVKLKATGVLESVIVCAAGAVAPAPTVKVRPAEGAGEAEIVPVFTWRVTWMVAGLLLAFGAVTTTVPTYVPGVRPAPFTLIESVPGVVPLVGVTESQLTLVLPLFGTA